MDGRYQVEGKCLRVQIPPLRSELVTHNLIQTGVIAKTAGSNCHWIHFNQGRHQKVKIKSWYAKIEKFFYLLHLSEPDM